MKLKVLFICAVMLLAGCAAKLVSDDFTGPTALVKDSYVSSSQTRLISSS